ncbi:MAG: fumarylacetoacetate hydrolase family protein [Sphingobium phenoxybenzoativorans]|uniref:Fumarylacetoacetate hydrolase family protein n=1 Tax=Sphingobium phenoxybenzoativorans TaxID=1592790 RepID=A0A975K592_9SPHN|nr:fumarylacetoacetate hydrolase family protein [Sphingobium phenoxybenzoativorans]QUT05046.1 fumarylacetoacetate hydrolase family protein [Sphingobium phenoxybenzoativorans]
MKLARIGPKGQERPAMLDAALQLRDLSGLVDDIDGAALHPDKLARLAALDPQQLPLISAPVRYGPPVARTSKFIAIGLNYRDHAAESGNPVPKEPVMFMKAISAIAGPDDDVPMPRGSTKMDWEIELGIVVGTRARYVEKAGALRHIAGYVLVNDISERFDQIERGGTWDKGKGHDGFGPVGPWLVTPDEVDVGALEMTLDVSGHRRQAGNTGNMIFDVATILSYVSQFVTLEPGDMIATGTPAGVGLGMKPPLYLSVGDEMRLSITGLGEQRQRVVASV